MEKVFGSITNVQRFFVATFIVYYLCRHEAYTWYYSDLMMTWPRSLVAFDPVALNHYFPLLLFSWLFTGLWYLVKPRLYSGSLFFFLSYLIVGRLNSYVFILRYDFSPMTFLLLTILLPKEGDQESKKLIHWIVKMGQFVWVSCFVTAAVAKVETAGFNWVAPQILRDFIFFENIMQGPAICENPTRIVVVNFILQNNFILIATSVFVMFFEFGYLVTLFSRRISIIFILLTVVFQITIQYLMHIEYYNYWLGLHFWLLPFFFKRQECHCT